MTFLSLKKNSLLLLVVLLACVPSKNDSSNRSIYLLRYLKSTLIVEEDTKNINIFLVYVDRCKTCKPNRIAKIIDFLKHYDNNVIIFNGKDTSALLQLSPFVKTYIDKKYLGQYGLIAPENQIFIIRGNRVVFDSFLDEKNYSQINKALKENK